MLCQEPGKALSAKLCAHLRPKCHPLLFDSAINSPATVRLNIYQLVLLAAMKLHCQVRAPLAAPQPSRAVPSACTLVSHEGHMWQPLHWASRGVCFPSCLVFRCCMHTLTAGRQSACVADRCNLPPSELSTPLSMPLGAACQVAETLPARGMSRKGARPGCEEGSGDPRAVLEAIHVGIRYVACLVQRRAAAVQRRWHAREHLLNCSLFTKSGHGLGALLSMGLTRLHLMMRLASWPSVRQECTACALSLVPLACGYSGDVIACPRRSKGLACRPTISACHIRWLGLQAFLRALGRKQARYGAVLRALRAELASPAFSRLKEQLAGAVDPARSAVFDNIIY